MSRTHKPREDVFAIVRLDPGLGALEDQITVKAIVRSRDIAEAEVRRLNELNAAKGCRYVWQRTRLLQSDETVGESAS